ncbi:oxidoreductase domain protein [Gemmatirosa kalamazoonensis]|uniref:Oxidoreductase domain protein n=1 Tax=Gemmatirosa kalamazoonensis TaxID=861299 RepID=W0RGZ2_9BACT|nr:Gfo/Idh/MocA family oxidoreductase [Gemmatirosa kalamazoonensis]AHG88668.1 oxidoreductase domain protein [Gemmatirosa kalamazoonensis]
MSDQPVSRRDFVGTTGTLAFGAMIVPRHVLGGPGYQAPSDTLNVAFCGVGGMGMSNWTQFLNENTVAVCDVDFPYVERSLGGRTRQRTVGNPPAGMNPDQVTAWRAQQEQNNQRSYDEGQKLQAAYTKAAKYADFREMLDKQKDIDAVVVATPDHLHAVIASAAMQAGKHVYVQKPLTYSVHEARTLAKLARDNPKLVTQMGNQGHSMDGTRRIREIVQSGVLGPIREVHVWTDRPVRYWAQGIPRPGASGPSAQMAASQVREQANVDGVPRRWNVRTVEQAIINEMAKDVQTPPPGLHWDLWLGPAPDIPYHPVYHPFSWRGWVDFGVSAIGDMGAHLIDQPFWALDLDFPTAISSSSTMWGGPASNPASYPLAMTTEYEFARRGAMPPVKLFWYDSGMLPPRPPFLPDDLSLQGGDGGGGYFVGTKGILTYETYGNNPKVYPASTAAAAEKVAKSVPRIEVPHEVNFAQACKGQTKASSPFEYAAKLTETMLLGIVALRSGQGKKILYDGANMRVTNANDANQWLTRQYRSGWAV